MFKFIQEIFFPAEVKKPVKKKVATVSYTHLTLPTSVTV